MVENRKIANEDVVESLKIDLDLVEKYCSRYLSMFVRNIFIFVVMSLCLQ
jgi:hypothetical protein